MESMFWTAFGASMLAALVTATGIYTIRRFESWGRKYNIVISMQPSGRRNCP